MKKDEIGTDYYRFIVYFMAIISIFACIVVFLVIGGNAEISGYMKCSVENINIDFEQDYKVTYEDFFNYYNNETYIKQNIFDEPELLNFNGIEDLSCTADYNLKAPYWFIRFFISD